MQLNFVEYVSSFFAIVVEYLPLLLLVFSLLLLIILLQTIYDSSDDYRIPVLYLSKITLCFVIVGLYGLLYFTIEGKRYKEITLEEAKILIPEREQFFFLKEKLNSEQIKTLTSAEQICLESYPNSFEIRYNKRILVIENNNHIIRCYYEEMTEEQKEKLNELDRQSIESEIKKQSEKEAIKLGPLPGTPGSRGNPFESDSTMEESLKKGEKLISDQKNLIAKLETITKIKSTELIPKLISKLETITGTKNYTISTELNEWFSSIVLVIIACCIASIYFLFNGYDIYIAKKILRLYKKADGEYIIISNSKLLFWLPLFWTEAVYIIGVGIKAKKNGDYFELSGINGILSWNFRFNFCKKSEYFDFNQFGQIYYRPYLCLIYTFHEGKWLFVQVNNGKNLWGADYSDSGEHSHNHLMGIYFSGNLYNEIEKIIYNIITQTDENKIIRKDIEEDCIIEYYYYKKMETRAFYDIYSSIAKVTNTKENFYSYNMQTNDFSILSDFNIKKFMQKSGICPRGSFEYGDEGSGTMIYCLNGNYFLTKWHKSDYEPFDLTYYIHSITFEEYLKNLEDDCKYQREKKNLEEKRRKIIYNIITQTGENEIIYADSYNEYYYREKPPIYKE